MDTDPVAQLLSDPRFKGQPITWGVTSEGYDAIRRAWLTHVHAEEVLFKPFTEDEFNTQTGVLIGEPCQTRQDAAFCKAGGCGHAQEAAQLAGPSSGVICLFERRQDGLDARQIVGACLGKRHGPCRSNEERDADLLFEGSDDP